MPFKQLIDENKMRVVFSKPFFDEVSVELLGDFNDWRRGVTPLSLSESGGEWLTTLDLERNGSFRYVYLVNDFIWHSDPEAEDFVEGPYGEEASMISTTIGQSQLEFLEDSEFLNGSKETAVFRKMLLPFDSWYLLGSVFKFAIEKAQQSAAELVLLRLSRANKSEDDQFDQENIYSILRGLQTQMQQLPIKVSVDTAIGVNASSIANYAQAHNIDLIVISDDQSQPEGEESMAEALAKTAVCATQIIRSN